MNTLYYGDNLDVLQRYVKDETVDLVYLDPPFNSNQGYNVLFAEHGTRSGAQIKAFEDTWEWNLDAEAAYTDAVERGGKVSEVMRAFMTFLGTSDMMAYLCMIAPRLVELRRVMKPTASIYLHCDPTASHYLKMLMDGVFGPTNFQNEILWKRTTAHSDAKQGATHFGRIHDVILFYRRGQTSVFNVQYTTYDETYMRSHYRHVEEGTGRRYRKGDLTANKPGGDTEYEWKGVRPYKGRYWAYSKEKMQEFETQGRLVYTRTGMPEYKRYLDEMPGSPAQDVWDDISPINSQAQERLGFPTQKPEALLERVIKASSNEGDLVLDPFCGCGTAVSVAQRLNRRWVGIDITHLAINLIKRRLQDTFGESVKETYSVVGEPKDHGGAVALAELDKYQFQWWALGLVHARPAERKKGADRGIDGRLFFHDEKKSLDRTKQIMISVKGGGTSVKDIRDLIGVLTREKAEIGVLITLQEPTRDMLREAAEAGFYASPFTASRHPKVQIFTVADLLGGKEIDYPRIRAEVTFKQAPRAVAEPEGEPTLPLEGFGPTGHGPVKKTRKRHDEDV